jgi:hypothetical protein
MRRAPAVAGGLVVLLCAYPSVAQPPQDDPARPVVSVYGTVLASTSLASSQLFIPDVPLWALAGSARLQPPAIGGQGVPDPVVAGEVTDFHVTARQTRLGLRVAFGPGSTSWTPSAQVEIDFFGARPAAGHGSVFNQPRLRLALITLRHTSGWTVVAGQDWAIFAPLNPTAFSHFAVPLAASGGNPWMRLPQIRIERTTALGDASRLLVQAGVLRPTGGGDSPAAGSLADAPSLSGERSGQPFYEGRIAMIGTRHGRPLAVGGSGHYGRERAEPVTLNTWGVAIDLQIPVHPKAVLSGEIWTGSNLDTFQAGVFQGVSIVGSRIDSVNARGGWLQLAVFPTASWTTHAGAGVDDPDIDGLSAALMRDRNRVIWGNALYRLHPQVTVAAQYTRFVTDFRTDTGRGHHGSLGIALSF